MTLIKAIPLPVANRLSRRYHSTTILYHIKQFTSKKVSCKFSKNETHTGIRSVSCTSMWLVGTNMSSLPHCQRRQIINESRNRKPLNHASGKIPYPMTNDFIFHVVLQTDEEVLKGLISSLLHMKKESIRSVRVKKYTLYNDKLVLSVLDLTNIERATEEDRLYQIDRWADFFRARTWEEIKMPAEKD